MTIHIPKWGVGAIGIAILIGIAVVAFILGQSSNSDSVRTTPGIASSQVPPPPCTEAAAQQAVLRSDLPNLVTGLSSRPHPFFNLMTGYHLAVRECADLTNDRRDEMVVGLGAGAAGRIFNWAIFSAPNGRWVLAYQRLGSEVSHLAVHSGTVVEQRPVFGPGDASCCPSGHKVARIAWNGHQYRVAEVASHLPAYQDCGPLPVPRTHVGSPDVQAEGIDCPSAIAAAKDYFRGYQQCGNDPPPNPPAALRTNPPPPWTDFCSGSARVVIAAE